MWPTFKQLTAYSNTDKQLGSSGLNWFAILRYTNNSPNPDWEMSSGETRESEHPNLIIIILLILNKKKSHYNLHVI